MKKSILIPILLVFIFSCSPDEETQAPTNSFQTTTPEKVAVQYTLTVTSANGGSVTDGGTFDDGTELTITATPNEGYEFVGWEGNDSSNSSLEVELYKDSLADATEVEKIVTVVLEQADQIKLTGAGVKILLNYMEITQ